MPGSEMRGRVFTMLTVLLLLLAMTILRAEMMRPSTGNGGVSTDFHAKRGGRVSNETDAGNSGRTRENHQTIKGCSKGVRTPRRIAAPSPETLPRVTQERTLGPHFWLLPGGHGIRSTAHSVYPISHCTARVNPGPFLNRLDKEIVGT